MGIIGAALAYTKLREKLTTDYVYQKLMERFPSSVKLPKAMKVEDWQSMWTTYPNINLWFDGLKRALIQHGYAEDKPQLVKEIFVGHEMPCDIPSELTFLFYIYCILLFKISIYFPLPKQDDSSLEITFKYAVLCHFIDFDETHLTKLLEGDKGGPHANTLTDPNLPCTGTQVFKDPGGYVTGVFGLLPLEVMPPVLIFQTRSNCREVGFQ